MTETTEAPAGSAGARPAASRRRGLVEWVVIVAVALAAAFLIKQFLIQAYFIPSPSMSPTIEVGNRVLVNKVAYDLHGVHYGDIVVFSRPPDDVATGNIDDLIKRVIGLPGQTLQTGPGGELLVDGHRLAQPYLTPAARANPGPPICSINRTDCVGDVLHLPADTYFVMGDNRDDSEDSRYFGPISGHLLVGRAFVRIWPLSRLHWF